MSNEVALSNETMMVFKKFFEINMSMKVVATDNKTLKIKSSGNNVIATADIDEEFPRDFGIYDIREFISVVGIIDNPILDFTDPKKISIRSSDNKQRLTYRDYDMEMDSIAKSYTPKNVKLPDSTVEFKVDMNDLKKVLSAATTMKLDYIGFKGEDGKLLMTAFAKNNGDGGETNSYNIEIGETEHTFLMFEKVEYIKTLSGIGDMDVTISRKAFAGQFNFGGMVITIGFSSNSTFEDGE